MRLGAPKNSTENRLPSGGKLSLLFMDERLAKKFNLVKLSSYSCQLLKALVSTLLDKDAVRICGNLVITFEHGNIETFNKRWPSTLNKTWCTVNVFSRQVLGQATVDPTDTFYSTNKYSRWIARPCRARCMLRWQTVQSRRALLLQWANNGPVPMPGQLRTLTFVICF